MEDMLNLEGEVLTLMVEEGKGDSPVVKTPEGKVGFLRGDKGVLKRATPGALVRAKVTKELSNVFFARVIEVVEESPSDEHIPVRGKVEVRGKEVALKLKSGPALRQLDGATVKAILFLEGS